MAMAMAAATVATVAARPSSSSLALLRRQKPKRVFSPLAYSSSSSSSSGRKLVLYSKPGCCLCDGLKEKLQAAFLISGPDSLHDVDLEVRDITTNPCWEKAYRYEIPVLARVLSDGSEMIPDESFSIHFLTTPADQPDVETSYPTLEKETLPSLSPRLGVELIQKKIATALSQ